jgi:hypothetical protein
MNGKRIRFAGIPALSICNIKEIAAFWRMLPLKQYGGLEMLDKIIAEGEAVRKKCVKDGTYGEYLAGEAYEKWIAKGIIYLEKNHQGETITKNFLEATKSRAGESISNYEKMMGILKAIQEFEE